MHEQFHSELKTDLDLERLPSGKFDTNDGLLHLAAFAYNCLRLLGQLGLTGEIAPVRHPAKRRRIKTVLQEVMYRAAKFVAHARRLVLDFGRGGRHTRRCSWRCKRVCGRRLRDETNAPAPPLDKQPCRFPGRETPARSMENELIPGE
jgi:hypothetical protein